METHHRLRFIGSVRLPLSHDLAGLACNRAIHAILAGLVGTHSKAIVHVAWDEMEVAVVGQGARGLALLDSRLLNLSVNFGVSKRVRMRVSSVTMAVGVGRLGAEQH